MTAIAAESSPPWEWVDGDAVHATNFALAQGVGLGVSSVGLALVTLAILANSGLMGLGALPGYVLESIAIGSLVLALGVQAYYPGRFPVVGRLGISPRGLQLVLPLRTLTVGWNSVELGPDWVRVSPPWGGQRFRLTGQQIARLARFLTPH